MHSRRVIFMVGLLAAVATPSAALLALEAATGTNDRASNAAMVRHVGTIRAEQLVEVANLQSQVNAILTCTRKGKFYTPSKTGADSDGCTDIEVTVE